MVVDLDVNIESMLIRGVCFKELSSWRRIDFACIYSDSVTKFTLIFTASRSPNSIFFHFVWNYPSTLQSFRSRLSLVH